jgi:glucokinase
VILAGDVGGTKILLEVGDMRSGRWRPALARRYAVTDFASMEEVLEGFLAEWGHVRPPRARITAGALGVAGPALGNRVTMTNRPWRLDGDYLAERFDIPHLRLLNDLAAAAYGLDVLPANDLVTLQAGTAVPDANRVLLGVGTGLGVAYLIGASSPRAPASPATTGASSPRAPASRATARGPIIVAGEGGHVGVSPATPQQVELWKELAKAHPRIEAEHVACGGALERDGEELFSANLGNVAGDQALNVMACGGVFLCGGVIARIAPKIRKEIFSAAFCAKGSHSSILMRIPVRAAVNERIGLLGAARVAALKM